MREQTEMVHTEIFFIISDLRFHKLYPNNKDHFSGKYEQKGAQQNISVFMYSASRRAILFVPVT
jgi:hypothetical protein